MFEDELVRVARGWRRSFSNDQLIDLGLALTRGQVALFDRMTSSMCPRETTRAILAFRDSVGPDATLALHEILNHGQFAIVLHFNAQIDHSNTRHPPALAPARRGCGVHDDPNEHCPSCKYVAELRAWSEETIWLVAESLGARRDCLGCVKSIRKWDKRDLGYACPKHWPRPTVDGDG